MTDNRSRAGQTATAQDEVAALASDLIRIDTSNPGDHSGPGERAAAEYVAAKLAEAGLSFCPDRPGRVLVGQAPAEPFAEGIRSWASFPGSIGSAVLCCPGIPSG